MAAFHPSENLGFVTDVGAALLPNRVALIQDDLQRTYGELDEMANRVANAALTDRVAIADRVAVLVDNDIRFAEVILGIMRAGGVAVPINPKLGPDRMNDVVVDAGARLIVTNERLAPVASGMCRAGTVDKVVVIGVDEPDGPAVGYIAWTGAVSTERPAVSLGPGALCMQPYTSGSTGNPKGVLMTHHGLLRNVRSLTQVLLLDVDDRVLASTPLFHMNATVCGLLPCLAVGASAVVLPNFDAVEVIRSIARYGCTYTQGVPAMYKMMLGHRDEIARHDLSSMRFLTVGSAPMPESLLIQLGDAFPDVAVLEGYGLTESGPVLTLQPRWGVRKTGSIGTAMPNMDLRVVEADGADAAIGEVGELWARGESNALGYHGLPEKTSERFTDDGWMRSGDLVRVDEDGFYYFAGRVDDMLNVGGENVYPAEVEALLAQHPDVLDVTVVGRPHEVKGTVPVAFVVRSPGTSVTSQELKDFFLQRGPAYAHPRTIEILDAMPLAPTGKTDRRALQQRARQAASSGSPS